MSLLLAIVRCVTTLRACCTDARFITHAENPPHRRSNVCGVNPERVERMISSVVIFAGFKKERISDGSER